MASGKIQRWALILGGYQYEISHKSGHTIAHADGLSRLPLPESRAEVLLPAETVILLNYLETTPVTVHEICRGTDKDQVIARVQNLVRHGWPESTRDQLGFQPFQKS